MGFSDRDRCCIAEEIAIPLTGRKIRYVASEELTGNEVAHILGTAIEKPDLKWVIVSDEQTQQGLEAIGMNPGIAAGLVEMYASLVIPPYLPPASFILIKNNIYVR